MIYRQRIRANRDSDPICLMETSQRASFTQMHDLVAVIVAVVLGALIVGIAIRIFGGVI